MAKYKKNDILTENRAMARVQVVSDGNTNPSVSTTQCTDDTAKKEYVAPIIEEVDNNNVVTSQIDVRTVEPENAKAIIGRNPFYVYRLPTRESRHIAKAIPAAVEMKVVSIVKNKIFGRFYKLSNGFYAPILGDYMLKG